MKTSLTISATLSSPYYVDIWLIFRLVIKHIHLPSVIKVTSSKTLVPSTECTDLVTRTSLQWRSDVTVSAPTRVICSLAWQNAWIWYVICWLIASISPHIVSGQTTMAVLRELICRITAKEKIKTFKLCAKLHITRNPSLDYSTP